jgi:hypothetical protein
MQRNRTLCLLVLKALAPWGTSIAAAENAVPSLRPRAGTILVYRLADGRTSRWTCLAVHQAGPGHVAEFAIRIGDHAYSLRMVHTQDGIALAWQTPEQPGFWQPMVLDYQPARASERWIARRALRPGDSLRLLSLLEQANSELVVEGRRLPCRKMSFLPEGPDPTPVFTGWVHPKLGLLRTEDGSDGPMRSELIHIGQGAG